MNSNFERNNALGIFKDSLRFLKFWRFLLNSTKFYYELMRRNYVYITIYSITTDFNFIPFHTNTITLIKQKDKNNVYNFTVNSI